MSTGLGQKVRDSMARAFAKKAVEQIAADGWLWNIGGTEGLPNREVVEAVVKQQLDRVAAGTSPAGWGKFEAGSVAVAEDVRMFWIRYLGRDLVEARWRVGLTDFRWAKVKVVFAVKRKRTSDG